MQKNHLHLAEKCLFQLSEDISSFHVLPCIVNGEHKPSVMMEISLKHFIPVIMILIITCLIWLISHQEVKGIPSSSNSTLWWSMPALWSRKTSLCS